jgi:RNA polymerase sigma-70 factor (ECF subfamily)
MDPSGSRIAGEGVVAAMERGESPEVTRLVERAKEGDPAAFDGLMCLYERRVIALGMQMGLRREDALDACQDAFLKVFKYIRRFRSGEVFFRWLYRLSVNVILDQQRSRPSGVISIEEVEDPVRATLQDPARSAQEQAESGQLAVRVRASLACLSRQERIVFVLRDLQQLPTEEIGRILGLSQITVRRHCMTARQKLREKVFGPRG